MYEFHIGACDQNNESTRTNILNENQYQREKMRE